MRRSCFRRPRLSNIIQTCSFNFVSTGFMTDHLHSYIPSFILGAVVAYTAAALLLILLCNKKQTQRFEAVEENDDHESVDRKDELLEETCL